MSCITTTPVETQCGVQVDRHSKMVYVSGSPGLDSTMEVCFQIVRIRLAYFLVLLDMKWLTNELNNMQLNINHIRHTSY